MGIYLIYTRVSTEDQARQGFSLPEQVAACRTRAEQLASVLKDPHPRILEFSDDLSGDLLDRPGLQAALELVRAKEATALVCLDPDRLARKLMHQLLVTDEIEQGGCRLEFVDHEYRQDPEGQLFYQMRGAIAEYEKAKILQRMSRGARGKARAGGVPSYLCPYGYTFRSGMGRALAADVIQPHPTEAQWVRTIFHWCADEGHGPHVIARRLNRLGVRAKRGGAWSPTVVGRLLRNPTYATGLAHWGGNDHRGIMANRRLPRRERRRRGVVLTPTPRPEAAVPLRIRPIVDAAVYQRAQEVLAGFRVGRHPDPKPRRRLLTSLGRCGECGGPLMYYAGRTLACRRRLQGSECRLPSKPAAAVEAMVWSQVCRWCAVAASAGAGDGAARLEPPPDREAERVALGALIQHKQTEVERWSRLYAEGQVPDTMALPAIAAARAAWTAAEARLEELSASPAVAPTPATGAPWPTLVAQATGPDALEQLTAEQRAILVHALVRWFTVSASPRGELPRVHVTAVWDAPLR